MIKKFRQIQNILTPIEIKRFKILIVLMVFCAIFETIGVGALIPLINFFTNADLMLSINNNILKVSSNLGLPEFKPINLILSAIAIIYVLKNLYLILFNWIDCKFAFKIRTNVSIRLFKSYLDRPYIFHIYNNSSALITNIVEESKIFGNVIMYLSALITECLIVTGLLIFLFFLKPTVTLFVVLIGFLSGALYYLFIKNRSVMGGQKRVGFAKKSTKYLHQGLAAIKDLIFLNAQKNFVKTYSKNIYEHGKITGSQNFIQRLPRIWFELTLITILLSIIFYLSLRETELGSILGVIAIFIITAARIIPSLNKILVALQYIKYAESSLNVLDNDFRDSKKLSKESNTKNLDEKINFNESIEYKNISFKYPSGNKTILKNINLKIKKDDFVGVIGKSGAGKSTLVDLITGLLKADTGEIIIDGLNLKDKFYIIKNSIGYVSQNIFLTDDTIKNNIAFGLDDNTIDNLKIEKAISTAQLTKFVNNLQFGLNTIVGERGVKISGGERQRIGIARALYNDPKILVFDEATSALDLETEKDILDTLLELKKDKTIIFITHRISSLKYCNKVYELENGILTVKKI